MKSSEESRYFYGCKFDRAKLDRAWTTAARGFPQESRMSVSTTIGITRTDASTLTELFEKLGDPESLSELTFHMDTPFTQDETRSVRVSISGDSTAVTVSGSDETWARGRFDELRYFFRDIASPLAMHPVSALGGPIVLLVAVVFGIEFIDGIVFDSLSTFPVAAAISFVVVACLGAFLRWKSVTSIVLAESGRLAWTRGDLMTLGILLVSVATLIIAIR